MTEQSRDRRPNQPPQAQGSLAEFIGELKRRRVIRVGLVYLVAGWLIIQVAQATFPALLLPDWTVTLVVVLTVLGFPVAVILAWAYQVEAERGDHAETSVQYVVDSQRKLDFVIIAALAAIIVILAIELYMREAPPPPTTTTSTESARAAPAMSPVADDAARESRPSIGVLPFLNLSDDPENQYFADGLAEEILNLLMRVREIDVAARTSSFYFKGKDVDIKTVARQLGVTNVLEGSVRRQGDRIRVTAQLIEAESGFHVWSSSYDRNLVDIFGIQDDIARQVVNALALVISDDSSAELNRIPTESFEAYQYYLQGRDYLRGEHNEVKLDSARRLFENAIGLDTNFAEAYAGLCDAYLAFYGRQRATEYFEKAERACHRGLTLDTKAVGVHTALGSLYRMSGQPAKAAGEFEKAISLNVRSIDAFIGLADTYKEQNNFEQAELTYQRAIEIQPGYWRAHLKMGNFLYYAGRVRESIDYFKQVVNLAPDNASGYLNLGSSYFMVADFSSAAKAWERSIELDPIPVAYTNVGSSYFFLGEFDKAAEMYRKASELAPDDFEIWGSIGDAYRYAQGHDELEARAYEKAIELGERLLAINSSDPLIIAPLAQYYAHTGNSDRAEELIDEAVALAPDNYYVHYFSAVTNVSLGNYDAAVAAIEKAVEFGYPANLLKPDAGLAPIIGHSRVGAVIKETGE